VNKNCTVQLLSTGAPQPKLDSRNYFLSGATQEGVAEDTEGGRSEGDTSPAKLLLIFNL